jgi:hypothetical protein
MMYSKKNSSKKHSSMALQDPNQILYIYYKLHKNTINVILISNKKFFPFIITSPYLEDLSAVIYFWIPLSFIKLLLPVVLPVLTHIFNHIFVSFLFPRKWKISVVLLIPKVSSPAKCSD